MTPPPNHRPPPQPGKPILDQQPEREAVQHSSVDGVPQEPPRKGTLLGLGTVRVPGPPPLPLEVARTVPAAAHQAPTQRAPSPVAVQVVRIEEANSGAPGASLPPPSRDRRDGEIAALRAENAKLRAKPSDPPDRGAWAKLGYRVAAAAVAAIVLVIAALGCWAVAEINAKAEATKAAAAAKAKETQTREEKWRSWAAVAVWILDCRDRRNVRNGEMLLPDLQKMGSARKMEAWQNNCPVELPPPP